MDSPQLAIAKVNDPSVPDDWLIFSTSFQGDFSGRPHSEGGNLLLTGTVLDVPSGKRRGAIAFATTDFPQSADDWELVEVSTEDVRISEIVKLDEGWALLAHGSSFRDMVYMHCFKDRPASPADWIAYSLMHPGSTFTASAYLRRSADRLCASFVTGKGINFGVSDNQHPVDRSAWQVYDLDFIGGTTGPVDQSMVIYRGKPVIAYTASNNLLLWSATVPYPTEQAHWRSGGTGNTAASNAPQLIEAHGRLLISYPELLTGGTSYRRSYLRQTDINSFGQLGATPWERHALFGDEFTGWVYTFETLPYGDGLVTLFYSPSDILQSPGLAFSDGPW